MGMLFDVSHLTIGFEDKGQMNKVVNDLSFSMDEGEILGVVGESGSGKSMTALAAMGLLSPQAHILDGTIMFDGKICWLSVKKSAAPYPEKICL